MNIEENENNDDLEFIKSLEKEKPLKNILRNDLVTNSDLDLNEQGMMTSKVRK